MSDPQLHCHKLAVRTDEKYFLAEPGSKTHKAFKQKTATCIRASSPHTRRLKPSIDERLILLFASRNSPGREKMDLAWGLGRAARQREAIRKFIDAFRAADMERFVDALNAMDTDCALGWPKVFRAVAKSPSPPDLFRRFLLNVWRHHGEHIRQEVGDDLLLADALRVMLPGYKGPTIKLYRGEGFRNRTRRTYGLCWSRDIDIARSFAETGLSRNTVGGSVLLEATVPPEAIICEVPAADDSYGEEEVVVDRRRLRGVKVLERFSQLDHDEFKSFQRS